jgi:hypothetical protein
MSGTRLLSEHSCTPPRGDSPPVRRLRESSFSGHFLGDCGSGDVLLNHGPSSRECSTSASPRVHRTRKYGPRGRTEGVYIVDMQSLIVLRIDNAYTVLNLPKGREHRVMHVYEA